MYSNWKFSEQKFCTLSLHIEHKSLKLCIQPYNTYKTSLLNLHSTKVVKWIYIVNFKSYVPCLFLVQLKHTTICVCTSWAMNLLD